MASAPETPVGEECIAVKIMDSDRTPSIPSSVDMNATQDISNEIVGHHIVSSNYAPQFDSAAAFILSRIRDTNDNFKPPRRGSSGILNKLARKGGMVEAMDSWTMPLPNAPTPALSLTSTSHQEQLASISSSLKRKRDPESEAPDFTQSTIACPESMVHSHSKVIASAQPSTAESSTPKTALGNLHSSISLSGQAAVENIREKRLSAITDGISPAKSELVGFYAGQASDIVRPISRSLDAQIAAAVRRARPAGRPRHGHTVLNPKSRQRQKNAKKALKRLIRAEHEVDTPEDEDVEEDVLPSTWPKAGQGLYSKLPPETEDRTFLADDNDDESFSHFMVDNLGKPMIVSTCA
ncbi:hypothetical protein E5D57_010277 [Metarhizium anisopliae]|nr:hypothetical protein E5D57_010277 [Metarhizium anisopliae]